MVSNKHTHSTREDNTSIEVETSVSRPKVNASWSRFKRRLLKHVVLLRVLIITGIIFSLCLSASFFLKSFNRTDAPMYAGLIKDFLTAPGTKVKSFESRTNIIVLGKGGEGHEAPDLTDSMIVVSVPHDGGGVKLISLPRDIWIPDLRVKLNSVYYWGNKREEKGGIILAKSSVEEIVGIPIHYAAVIDFSGFKRIIDTIGGVDVEIENSFADHRYPIPGRENDLCGGDREYKCRYETVVFEKGLRHMNGEEALKFARSRNAEGDEGTDLARAARQEKVVDAVKNKILSKEILTSPNKLSELKGVLLSSIETDLTESEAAVLGRKLFDNRDDLNSEVLPENLIEFPSYTKEYDNQYVFIPKEADPVDPSKKSWSKVHEWIRCFLSEGDCN